MACSRMLECTEENAERFKKETGMLAPFKDDAWPTHTYEEKDAKWKEWSKKNYKCIDDLSTLNP